MGRKDRKTKIVDEVQDSAGADGLEPVTENEHPPKETAALTFTILAGVIAAVMLYRSDGWKWTTAALVITGLLILVILRWRALRRKLSDRALVLKCASATIALAVIGSAILLLLAREGDGPPPSPNTPDSRRTRLLVADFAAPTIESAKTYRVTEIVRGRLTHALRQYPDVEVAPLGRGIEEDEGSAVARSEGQRKGGAIVVWGWYGITKSSVILSVNFEVLSPDLSTLLSNYGADIGGDPRTYPLAELDRFRVQQKLSGEMIYLSELTVGIVRIKALDLAGGISHLTGAVASGQSKQQRALALFHRCMAYSVRGQRGIVTQDRGSKQDLAAAIRDCGEVIRLHKRYAVGAYQNRAEVRSVTGNFTGAISDINAAIRLRPGDPDSRFLRAQIYSTMKDFSNALADLNSLIVQAPSAKAYIARCVTYYEKEDYANAIADCSKALKLEPKEAEHPYLRGTIYMRMGELGPAIKDFDRAIELQADQRAASRYHMNRGVAYKKSKSLDPALADFNWIIERIGDLRTVAGLDYKAYMNRAEIYETTGRREQALADFSEAIRLRPRDADLYLRRASFYLDSDDPNNALADADRAIELEPDNALAYHGRAAAHLILGDSNNAILDLSNEIKLLPLNRADEARFARARAYILAGNRKAAISDLHHVSFYSKDPKLRNEVRQMLKALGG